MATWWAAAGTAVSAGLTPRSEAVADAGRQAQCATLYVTMEPCCFHGKTPACTNAVQEAGIERVVAATLDPTRA